MMTRPEPQGQLGGRGPRLQIGAGRLHDAFGVDDERAVDGRELLYIRKAKKNTETNYIPGLRSA